MSSQSKIKRSSVAGKVPTTSDIATGELAINTKDKKIYSSNGTAVFSFTNDYIQVANAASTYLTKNNPVITGTLTANGSVGTAGYYLRTSGSGIYWSPVSASGGGATWAALTGTNTALRTLISDRLQIANASTLYATKSNPTTSGLLAHTGRVTISTNLSVSGNATVTGTMAATGIVSGSELTSTLASGDEGGQINLAKPPNATISGGVTIDAYQNKIRIFEQGGSARGVYIDLTAAAGGVGSNLLTGGGGSTTQYLQVANAVATYQTKSVERAALANTNSYIATKASWAALTGTNTAIRTLVSDRYQVANVNTLLAAKATWTSVTGTNTALRTLISDRLQVANAEATYQTKAVERAALANTNAYIATKASWSALTSTNTAIRSYVDTSVAAVVNSAPGTLNTLYELAAALANDPNFATSTASLIATKISVANTKAYLANTNSYIATKASWTSVTGTNTALRTLISDRYQVANVNTLLAAKATWSALTATNTAIRLLDAQKLQVANATTLLAAKATWTGLTTTNTALRTLISDRLQVANASSTYLTKNNPIVTGTLTANGSVGTAGYYLRTSGSGVYWSPVSGGGSAANGFSGILVGANVVSADSTTDTLTLVAGSGITISANPATDTITFTATGGGGTFTGGTISGATTVTDATASTSNLTGAFKVTGGVGVTGNIYTAGRVGYASNTTSGTSAVYTYYNATNGSLDTVFG